LLKICNKHAKRTNRLAIGNKFIFWYFIKCQGFVPAMCTAAFVAQGARVHRRIVIKDVTVRLRCAGQMQASLDDAHSTTGEMGMDND
jgi:hypothetical protein